MCILSLRVIWTWGCWHRETSVMLITHSQCLFLNYVTVWCFWCYDQCIDNIKSVTSAGALSAQSILFMLIYGNDRSSTLTLHFLRPSYDTSFPQSRVLGLITGMPRYARHLIRKSGTGFPLVPYSAHITHQSPRPVVSALFLPESLLLQVTRADWLDQAPI